MSSRTIEIIDPEGEKRHRLLRKVFIVGVLASMSLFGYPVVKDYSTKWQALRAGRKLALYLSMLKTRAILNKTPLEARFIGNDLIEVFEVSSCGPNAKHSKLWEARLSDFAQQIQFVREDWANELLEIKEPILNRFCYDPLYGSSIFADGLAHGAIFLAHESDAKKKRSEQLVQVSVEGASADLEID